MELSAENIQILSYLTGAGVIAVIALMIVAVGFNLPRFWVRWTVGLGFLVLAGMGSSCGYLYLWHHYWRV